MSGDASSSDGSKTRLLAGVAGVVLGQFAGSQAETIARISIFAKLGSVRPSAHSVVEQTQLFVVLFTFCAVVLGWWSARRGWTRFENVVITVCVTVVVASLSMVKIYLPLPDTNVPYKFSLASLLYYSVWFVILVVSPILLMPSRTERFEDRSRDMAQVVGVACAAALAGGIGGTALRFLLQAVAGGSILPLSVPHAGGLPPWEPSMWIIQPGTIGAIAGAFVTVCLLPLWFPALWRSKRRRRLVWIVGFAVVSVVWAGVYGHYHYARRLGSWGFNQIHEGNAEAWQFSLGFGMLPLLVLSAFALAWISFRSPVAQAMPHTWPVRRGFWIAFASYSGAAFALGLTAAFGPIMARAGASDGQIAWFALCHGLNGFVAAMSLRLACRAMAWMDVPRPAET